MEITNNAVSGVYTNEYKSKNMTKKASSYEDTVKSKTSKKTDKILGRGFIHDKNTPNSYGMSAKYTEDSTENDPVIKVKVAMPNGVEEYRVNINKVNPANASEVEMFALCCYADDKGIGSGGTFGSWQTLNYYKDNAAHNGYFELSDTMEQFKSQKKDWGAMVGTMMKDYMSANQFKQGMDGKMLLAMFQYFAQSQRSLF